jgi:SpoVK/Ycf46/Vps4 family AAA+-type ATPase
MARADLLKKLVESSLSGNSELLKKTIQAIIADERNKQHGVLAKEIEGLLTIYNHPEIKKQFANQLNNTREISGLISEITPKKVLDDLFLEEEVINTINKYILEYHRKDLLRSYNIEPRNRLLFTGSPGNGKTSLAEAIANALMLPMYVVRYDGIIGSYLGETATKLKKVFDYISTQTCILFFDEFDAIAKERGDIHETGEIKRVVNSLLMQVDKLPDYVIVIAATNHPELLDRAVWRRFQIRISLERPDKLTIEKYLVKFSSLFEVKLGVDLAKLAEEVAGSNFSDIEEMTKEIIREYVLSIPNANMKSITNYALKSLLKKNNRT